MIRIYGIGCQATHDAHFVLESTWGWNCYILLYLRSRAFFCFGGRNQPRTLVDPGNVILIPKSTPLFYGAVGEPYVNDWLLFDSDQAAITGRPLAFQTPLAMEGRYPVGPLFAIISDAHFAQGPRSLQTTSHLVEGLLDMVAEASTTQTGETRLFPRLLDLRKRIYRDPQLDWHIPDLARELELSRGYFLTLYKKTFGTTCNRDVVLGRVMLARELLQTSELSAKEIAFRCGYASQVHFSRQFKAVTGYSPLDYRMQSRTG